MDVDKVLSRNFAEVNLVRS